MYKDAKTSRVATVVGAGVDNTMKVLSLHGNGYLNLGDFKSSCYSDPALCENGFSVSMWIKHKGEKIVECDSVKRCIRHNGFKTLI